MLGWWITVSSLSPAAKDSASREEKNDNTLATWETGLGGTSWLENLAAQGKATWDRSNDGYPWRFVARAADVLPLLTAGLPKHDGVLTISDEEFVTPAGWSSQVQLRKKAVSLCAPDAFLTVDAWDQS